MRTKLCFTAAAAMLAFLPALAAATTGKTPEKGTRSASETEVMYGKIAMVDTQNHVVVVKDDSSGIPFDLEIKPDTEILSGDNHVALDQLKDDISRDVTVEFLSERSGDVARSIRVRR